MILRPPRSTRTDTLFPYTTRFRSELEIEGDAREVGVRQGIFAPEIGPQAEMDYPQQCSLAKPVGALGLLRVGVGVGEHDIHAVGKAHRPEGRKIGPDALDHRPGSEPASMRRPPFSIMITRKIGQAWCRDRGCQYV